MKKNILAASLLSLLFIVPPVSAVEEHHQGKEITASTATRMETEKIDASVQKMQEIRKKIEAEKNPTARKELLHQHMQMMQDGMNMMGGQGGMTMQQRDPGSMPMADRMAMMEEKMAMMEKMMGQGGGMMGGQRGMMMGGMMGGPSGGPINDRMDMMEKKMMMMQEMMNGMMMQQEMMMK